MTSKRDSDRLPIQATEIETLSGSRRFDQQVAAGAARYFDADTADYADDLPAIQAYARRTRGPLLELGCGTGRLLIPLARAGYQVTGVDLSPAMLAITRQRAETVGVAGKVTLIEGDFTTVPLAGNYRFAFIVMNTFLHLLTQDEQIAALRHWHAALAPGGLLLIDVFAPDVAELAGLTGRVEFDKSWQDVDTGAMVVKQVIRTVEQAEQLMHVIMFYDEVAPDAVLRRTVVPFDLRYVWRFEAELLLEKAGFEIEEVYGDWDLSPFDSASERLILVARKG
jgi:SAM-dependent methyltransferase